MMNLHILGICGTFMGSLAILARQAGHQVSGSDQNVYPPMSTQLTEQGITCLSGYHTAHLQPHPDQLIIGNALSRGNDAVEYALNQGLNYCSGPAWLAQHILPGRWVLAVAGTHGKTTTASMLAWILDYAGLKPGFLIGGVPQNFGVSARLGEGKHFVVEADEYDTAFFDKRSKFVHYQPRTLVLNNLEFDHADIFSDLAAIQRQFHHLIRTVPSEGLIISPDQHANLNQVLDQGCWTQTQTFSGQGDWTAQSSSPAHDQFQVYHQDQACGQVHSDLPGIHNQQNALAAIAAAVHVGVNASTACEALCDFKGVKRRMETRGIVNDIHVYDDFAHHPTAIELSIQALRQRIGSQRLIAVLEPRSNTMRMGVHKDSLASALREADQVYLLQADDQDWQLSTEDKAIAPIQDFADTSALLAALLANSQAGDHILIMSNGGFAQIHQRLLDGLQDS